jgi:hypothetical protein
MPEIHQTPVEVTLKLKLKARTTVSDNGKSFTVDVEHPHKVVDAAQVAQGRTFAEALGRFANGVVENISKEVSGPEIEVVVSACARCRVVFSTDQRALDVFCESCGKS